MATTPAPTTPDLSVQQIATRAAVSLLVVVSGLALIYFFYSIRAVILQLVLGLLFAIALSPLVRLFMKRGMGRLLASVLAVIISSAALIGIVAAIAAPLVTQGGELVRNAPQFVDQITGSPLIARYTDEYDLDARARGAMANLPQFLAGSDSPLLGALSSVVGVVSTAGAVIILALFMLIEGPDAWNRFLKLLKPDQERWMRGVSEKIVVAVGGFINGNLFISLIAGIVTLVTLLLLKVPYAFALAALVAVFDLIPLIGATIASVAVVLVALSQGLVTALIVGGVMLAYQFIEGNFIQPIVYSRAVQLSQLLIVVATIIGAALGGILGVLLAIPAAATVQIIIVELLRGTHAGDRAQIGEIDPAPAVTPR